MIIVRDVFQLKYGTARPVKALMQESKKFMTPERQKNSRVMFDLVGPAYTMVLENTYANISEWEKDMSSTFNEEEWKTWYPKFTPHVNSSYREIFTLLE